MLLQNKSVDDKYLNSKLVHEEKKPCMVSAGSWLGFNRKSLLYVWYPIDQGSFSIMNLSENKVQSTRRGNIGPYWEVPWRNCNRKFYTEKESSEYVLSHEQLLPQDFLFVAAVCSIISLRMLQILKNTIFFQKMSIKLLLIIRKTFSMLI